jgi:hypothetical protein
MKLSQVPYSVAVKMAYNGKDIFAVVVFCVPSVMVKDKKLI